MFLPRSEPRLHQMSHHPRARNETFQIILESSTGRISANQPIQRTPSSGRSISITIGHVTIGDGTRANGYVLHTQNSFIVVSFHFCHFDSFVFCSFLDIIPCFFFLDFKFSSMRSDCRRRIFSTYDTHLFFLFCFRSHFLSISYFFFLLARIPGELLINDTVMHWESLSLCTP